MNARRLTAVVSIALILLTGATFAQVPDPAVPPEQPTTSAAQPPIPPGLPGPTTPPVPPALTDPYAPVPSMTPDLPNLQVPPPAGIDGLTMPPNLPQPRQSNNLLLKLFDTDGDGILSGDEVEAAPARLWELDRNLNAEISIDELALISAPRWQERRRGIRGYVPPTEPTPAATEPITPAAPEPTMPALPGSTPTPERAKFEVYPLRGLDPGQTLATLQQLLQGHPQARLTFDGRSQSILALAPPSVHAQIRDTLANLLEGERRGIPGLGPAMEGPAAQTPAMPVIPRPVPLYNAQAKEVLRVVREVYRDRIVEPAPQPAEAPGLGLPPGLAEPAVPAGKMVVGEGMQPNTIVISADDKLFFEVLDLIERLDESQEAPADEK